MADSPASSSAPSTLATDHSAEQLAPDASGKHVKKHRDWCVTLNNYTPEEVEAVKAVFADVAECAICGYEVGRLCGTPHLQIYIRYYNAHSFSSVRRDFPRAHIGHRNKGSPAQAWDYCLKDGNYFTHGDRPSGKGHRSDLDIVRSSVRSDKPIREYALDVGPQALRYAENLSKYLGKKRTWEPVVVWLYGRTGTGKTRMAHELCGDNDPFVINEQLKWWDGYDGHSHVIIDDFRSSHVTLTRLIVLLDRYSCTIEVKGGMRQLLATHMFITCPYPPHLAYKLTDSGTRVEDIHQLIRRIHIVARVDRGGVAHCEKDGAWSEYTPADGYDGFNRFLADEKILESSPPAPIPESSEDGE